MDSQASVTARISAPALSRQPLHHPSNTLGSQRFLQWSKLSYADGYIVYKYDQKANKYTRVKKITSNKTNFCFVPNLRRGYGYRVLAYMKYNGKIYYGALSKAPVKNTSLTGTITDSKVWKIYLV